jgi:hypothetical protein
MQEIKCLFPNDLFGNLFGLSAYNKNIIFGTFFGLFAKAVRYRLLKDKFAHGIIRKIKA